MCLRNVRIQDYTMQQFRRPQSEQSPPWRNQGLRNGFRLRNTSAVLVFIKSRPRTISWVSWMQFTSSYPFNIYLPTTRALSEICCSKLCMHARVWFSLPTPTPTPIPSYSSHPPWHNRSNREAYRCLISSNFLLAWPFLSKVQVFNLASSSQTLSSLLCWVGHRLWPDHNAPRLRSSVQRYVQNLYSGGGGGMLFETQGQKAALNHREP